jgi:hypothetical protein
LRLRWTEAASRDLIELAEISPLRASAVIVSMEWMAGTGFSLGRPIGQQGIDRYWPVPPFGVVYMVDP